MEFDHAKALTKCGALRIGTLYEYRDQDKYSSQTLDRDEGKLRHVQLFTGDGGMVDAHHRSIASGDPAALKNVRFTDCQYNQTIFERDLYIYCLSHSPAWNASIDPKYDACVEIHHVEAFVVWLFQTLVATQHVHSESVEVGNVDYSGREHASKLIEGVSVGGPKVRPALLKPLRYSEQRECRLIFEPTSLPILPIFASDQRIAAVCRLHSRRP